MPTFLPRLLTFQPQRTRRLLTAAVATLSIAISFSTSTAQSAATPAPEKSPGSTATNPELTRLLALAKSAQTQTQTQTGDSPSSTNTAGWRDFLDQSADFAAQNPDLELWTQRGNAALALNDATAGQEAGAQLLKLGGLTKKSESTAHHTLAKLVLKGWATLPSPIPPQRKAPRKGKIKIKVKPQPAPTPEPAPVPTPDYDAAAKTLVTLISKAYGQNVEASNRRQQAYLYPRYNKETRELTFQLRSQRVDKFERILIERANITIPVPLITYLAPTKNRWGNGLRIDTLPDQILNQPVTAASSKKTGTAPSAPESGPPLSTITILFTPRPESATEAPNQHLIDIQALTNALLTLRGAPATAQ